MSSHGRFSGLLLLAISLPLVFDFASPVYADGICGADGITFSTRADTIFVGHANSLMNCCKELAIRVAVVGSIIEFYESDEGDPCRCVCCFDYTYLAGGFAAGYYQVFVYDETGSRLFGQGTVNVEGSSPPHRILALFDGICTNPQAVVEMTWGKVRSLYR